MPFRTISPELFAVADRGEAVGTGDTSQRSQTAATIVCMTRSRRTALIRLLAEIDQEIAQSHAVDPQVSRDERRYSEVQIEFRRRIALRIERMLGY